MQSVDLHITLNPDKFPFIWDRINDIVLLLDEMLKYGDLDRYTYAITLEKLYAIKDFLLFASQLCSMQMKTVHEDIEEVSEEEFKNAIEKYFL